MLEREKQVATVFWQWLMIHHFDAHLEAVLRDLCIVMVADAPDSEAMHAAKLSV